MAETSLFPTAPRSLRELRQFLDTLEEDDGGLGALLKDPSLCVWCATFRFDAIPDNISQSGSQVDATLANIPASGTLLHYDDVTAPSMRTLIEAGVPVDETVAEGLTPLFIAVRAEREEETTTLLEIVADRDGWTVLYHAASSSCGPASLMRLLDGGFGLIDRQDTGGITAMFVSGPGTLSVLLEYRANRSIKNMDGHDVMEYITGTSSAPNKSYRHGDDVGRGEAPPVIQHTQHDSINVIQPM